MTVVRSWLDRGLDAVLALLMAAAVTNVCWQVVSRFVLASPSSMTEELARVLLVWIGLLGAARATGAGAHLSIGVLRDRVGPRGTLRLDRVRDLAILLFALVVLVVGGVRLAWLTWVLEQRTAAVGLPLAVVYAAGPVAGLAMAFYAVCALAGVEERERA